eukprot:gene10406-biopygen3197
MPSSERVFVAPRPVRGSIYLGDSAFEVPCGPQVSVSGRHLGP